MKNLIKTIVCIFFYLSAFSQENTLLLQKEYKQELENVKLQLQQLGYCPMPVEMQAGILAEIKNENTVLEKKEKYSPFSSIDNIHYYVSLSKNKFPEVNTAQLNRQSSNQGIITFSLGEKGLGDEGIDPSTFALSIDPLAEKFPSESPYSAMGNDPVNLIDPTGESAEASIDFSTHTVTLKATINIYGAGATPENAQTMQDQLDAEYNTRTNTFKDPETGEKWTVQYEFDVKIVAQKPDELPGDMTQNYVEITDNEKTSYVKLDGRTGVWRGNGRNGSSLKDDNPTAHEMIHLLLLDDHYTSTGVFDAATGVDTRESTTSPGWKGSMSGEAAGLGHISDREAYMIVRNALSEAKKNAITTQQHANSLRMAYFSQLQRGLISEEEYKKKVRDILKNTGKYRADIKSSPSNGKDGFIKYEGQK